MDENGESPTSGENETRKEVIKDLYFYFRHILESEGSLYHNDNKRGFELDNKPYDSANLQVPLDPSLVDKLRAEKKGYGSIGINTDNYPCNCGGVEEGHVRKVLQGCDSVGPRPKLPDNQPIKLNRVAQLGSYVLDVVNPENCVFETVHYERGRETRPLTDVEINEIKSWQGRMTLERGPVKLEFHPEI